MLTKQCTVALGMFKTLASLLLGAAATLAGCQPKAETVQQAPVELAQPAPEGSLPGAKSEAMAMMQVSRYVGAQPNASLYVLDSARVNDNGTSWQILVPRTDWANRMPNRARFEVNKATGEVSAVPVK